jgi:uridine phosphorylase
MGEPVSVTSTGIGGPSTAIAVEELAAIGADTFIRVGTSGGMQPHTWPGDLVVATAAVRDEGTTSQYIPLAYPAVAHVDVVAALRHAAGDLGGRYHAGIVHSKDSFYGEVEPGRMPIGERLRARWRAWVRGNVLCSEMEAAALFVVASILGKRAGGLMLVVVNVLNLDDLGPLGPEDRDRILSMQQQPIPSLDGLINTAIVGLKVLIRMDQERA